MSILDDYFMGFEPEVQHRGRDLYRRRTVKIMESAPDRIRAVVDGVNQVGIFFHADMDSPHYLCSCPYMDENDGEPCKHAWATVLQAKDEGVLPDGEAPGPPEDDESDEEDSFDGNDDDQDDDDDQEDQSMKHGPSLPEILTRLMAGRMPGTYGASTRGKTEQPAKKDSASAWKQQFQQLARSMQSTPAYGDPNAPSALAWPDGRRIVYLIDRSEVLSGRGLVIEVAQETPKKSGGGYDRPKQLKIGRDQVSQLPDPEDRQILTMLLGARRSDYGYYGYYDNDSAKKFMLPEAAYTTTLRTICRTGRCRLKHDAQDTSPQRLAWDGDGDPWEFFLQVKPSPGGRYLVLDGSFRRREPIIEPPKPHPAVTDYPQMEQSIPEAADANDGADSTDGASTALAAPTHRSLAMTEPTLVLRGGLLIENGRVAPLNHFGAFDLIASMREGKSVTVPIDQRDELLSMIMSLPRLPRLDLPEELTVQEVRPAPKPRLVIRKPKKSYYYDDERLVGEITFDYDGQIIARSESRAAVYSKESRRVVLRDMAKEMSYFTRLFELGFRNPYGYADERDHPRLQPNKLPRLVAELIREGWHVEADGKLYRQPGEFKVNVSSGIDWFELHAEVQFGDQVAKLPKLLAALKRGETTVVLDDGTFGMLPEEWLKKYAALAGVGEQSEDHVKFSARQVGFLDVLLSQMPEATFDAGFRQARDAMQRFNGVQALDPAESFVGTLRQYQREGLGWMAFLRTFAFGGCLADDMGLGKTVQVLALLEERRRMRSGEAGSNGTMGNGEVGNGESKNGANGKHAKHDKPIGPSLVVAPRSLIFNWKQEAAKFTPQIKVLDHTSVVRDKSAARFGEYDIVLTTYGTLRRDMAYFKDVHFDYAILDEAQAIKNANSESAKAARLVQATHRLALSGTPVQNHLGELWSLFEFLNPGMMGTASVFRATTGGASPTADPATRELLCRALRPFILRRTKEQVAKDLPEKTEQTIFCELESEQRKLYNELREHYRASLLDRIAKEGMNKAKIQVLEALLRLRQAACHPGLIDKKRTGESSAKLDALMGHISDVVDEGHKVLVFSQFTSMLAIVREKLDKQKVTYEYLDGRTRDRQARVERFQTDPDCKLFLISLKAGGLGLNLTAAEYVFLLDPWWNPAVEAQAIDRAYRIGQTQRVFAYRLIAKDTVEEKVLQLQQTKKDLADAIINADNSLIRSLKRDDLELLLS